jgi:hypothetical protein
MGVRRPRRAALQEVDGGDLRFEIGDFRGVHVIGVALGRGVGHGQRLAMKNKLVELPDRKYGANHHIWDNNGTWWCHLSLERRSGPAKRIRFSLRTNNVREARKRRDLIMSANEAKAKALIKSWK